MYFMCKQFGVLPDPGGWLQQSARIVHIFEQISIAESERQIRDQAKQDSERRRAGYR